MKAKNRFRTVSGDFVAQTKQPARSRAKAKLERPEKRRSVCPVACTLDIIGDKWSLLIIRDMLGGKSHFKEFLAAPEKIATNILAERLTRLASHGLIERHASTKILGKEAYRLTDKGRSFRPLLAQIKAWGLEHIQGTDARLAVSN
jgi:DNA-binding HxlR family transcriptional regulator